MSVTLLFDLDGTLTDSAPGITRCIAHALEAHGLPAVDEARLRDCVGPPLHASFLELTGDARLVEGLVAAYRERYVDVGMFENVVYDGVEALLDGLAARGVALHVVTSKPAPYAERVLEHFDLRRRFGAVYGSSLDGALSEKPALLEAARRGLTLDPPRAAMVGDRGVDMAAARAHGMAALGVRWGYGSDDELLRAGAQRLVDEPIEILRWLEPDAPSPG